MHLHWNTRVFVPGRESIKYDVWICLCAYTSGSCKLHLPQQDSANKNVTVYTNPVTALKLHEHVLVKAHWYCRRIIEVVMGWDRGDKMHKPADFWWRNVLENVHVEDQIQMCLKKETERTGCIYTSLRKYRLPNPFISCVESTDFATAMLLIPCTALFDNTLLSLRYEEN